LRALSSLSPRERELGNTHMRVLLIHQAFVTPDQGGGTRHYEFGRHCVRQGHEFTVVASGVSYLTGRQIGGEGREPTPEATAGVRILRAKTLEVLHRSFVWRVLAFVYFMLTSFWTALRSGHADIVMGTSPPIFQVVSAWLVARLRGCPFLLEIRDLWPAFAIEMGVLTNPHLIAASRWLEGFLYRRASHLLVNSPAYRGYLIGKGIPEEKISLIPNGVDPDMFTPEATADEVLEGLGLRGKFVVSYAGALGLANDIPTLLRAAEGLRDQPEIHFVLVGDGKERSNLERMTEEFKLPNVTFTGALPKSETRNILSASGACVALLQDIPMFRTTYPNKVFDYMAAEKPTILAIDGAIREVVEAAGGGIFVPPGDVEALRVAVKRLSRDPEEARRMGRAARDYVVKHFNRKEHAEQFVELTLALTGQRAD